MPRRQWFEFEDLPWFPRVLRDLMTDYLHFVTATFGLFNSVVPVLVRAMERTGSDTVLDLCSGGAGPYPELARTLESTAGRTIRVRLSDRFPNVPALERACEQSEGRVDYVRTPVDATAVPKELRAFRTLFSSFHHFSPDAARAVLADAVNAGVGIGIFESTGRTAIAFLQIMTSPFGFLFLTPRIRPFRFVRYLFTYLLPLVPLAALWDGFVSNLRTYSEQELRALVATIPDGERYQWEVGTVPVRGGARITYLTGVPR